MDWGQVIINKGFKTFLSRSAPEVCPLKDGNILNVKLFIKDDIECRYSFIIFSGYSGSLN